MLTRVNDMSKSVVSQLLTGLFAALICVVALQVFARNVFSMPMIWTLDVAQLLFSWCIFLGAGIAFRQGEHYIVDLWPASGTSTKIPLIASFLAGIVVVYVLTWHGWEMTEIAARRESQTLGISISWFYAPIPICGLLIGFALLEKIENALTKKAPQ